MFFHVNIFLHLDFTEMMRVLDYPRKISLTNFRNPNFPLVAEILVWLVKRFDADVDIPNDHSTEHDRIELIRSVAEFIVRSYFFQISFNHLNKL